MCHVLQSDWCLEIPETSRMCTIPQTLSRGVGIGGTGHETRLGWASPIRRS